MNSKGMLKIILSCCSVCVCVFVPFGIRGGGVCRGCWYKSTNKRER